MNEKRIIVVAAVLVRDGRYLLCRRPPHKRHGGLWEFPGGKLHDEESLAGAARRELREELELEVTNTGSVLFESVDPGSPFLIRFVEVEALGEPVAIEHDELTWAHPRDLAAMPLAPTDSRFAHFLLEQRS